ncbi:MAG: hypothetical protein O6922_08540, partial [Chloroflexi bacterium]|nr:hypothetical protein [Chloroflexota bacterium]
VGAGVACTTLSSSPSTVGAAAVSVGPGPADDGVAAGLSDEVGLGTTEGFSCDVTAGVSSAVATGAVACVTVGAGNTDCVGAAATGAEFEGPLPIGSGGASVSVLPQAMTSVAMPAKRKILDRRPR